ncbi:unnamed protein product, partial [Effrenium voratum]
ETVQIIAGHVDTYHGGSVRVSTVEGKGRVLLAATDFEPGERILLEYPLIEALADSEALAFRELQRLKQDGQLEFAVIFYWAALCSLTAPQVAEALSPWRAVPAETQVQALELHRPACPVSPSLDGCNRTGGVAPRVSFVRLPMEWLAARRAVVVPGAMKGGTCSLRAQLQAALPHLSLPTQVCGVGMERRSKANGPRLRCESDAPVVVVGGGVMGLSTAWSLARSGMKVVLFDGGHSEKGSWGESRIARVSYKDEVLLKLARRSYELYAELGKQHAEPLMCKTGCLDVGFQRGSLDDLANTYQKLGQKYERLNHAEVQKRWPMLQLSKDYVEASVYCERGDAVCASVVLEALKEQVQKSAHYVEEPVVRIDRDRKMVTTADGKTQAYSKVVVAAGIWTNKVLQAMDLPLLPLVTSVEQQTYYNTPTGSEQLYSDRQLPVVVEHIASPEPQMKRRGGYMIPHLPHGVAAVKFGMHRQGPLLDHEDFPLVPGSAAKVSQHFSCAATRARGEVWCTRWPEHEDAHLRAETDAFRRRILPSLTEEVELTMRCPYDQHLFADEDFVVGRHPLDPDVVMVSGFAGEGFKFGPAVGEMAASLVRGARFPVPEAVWRFRLERPQL